MRVNVVAMVASVRQDSIGEESKRFVEELAAGRARFARGAHLGIGERPAERIAGEQAGPAARVPRSHVEVRLGDAGVARRRAVVGPTPGSLVAQLAREVEVLGPDLRFGRRQLRLIGAQIGQERAPECVPVAQREGGVVVDRERRVGIERGCRCVDVGSAERNLEERGGGAATS